MLPGRVEEQRRCRGDVLSLYRVPERPCKVNDAGKIGMEDRWEGKCVVAQGEASVSINPMVL